MWPRSPESLGTGRETGAVLQVGTTERRIDLTSPSVMRAYTSVYFGIGRSDYSLGAPINPETRHCSARLFSDTRASDGRFQGAVACAADLIRLGVQQKLKRHCSLDHTRLERIATAPFTPVTTVGAAVRSDAAALSLAKLASAFFSTRADLMRRCPLLLRKNAAAVGMSALCQ